MANRDTKEFFAWLDKSKSDEFDILKCRKMQSVSIAESETVFGITSLNVCGFINRDMVQLGGEIRQHYDETKEAFYKRVFDTLIVAGELMDAVNAVLADEGAWSKHYFSNYLTQWYEEKMKTV